jgi:serine/threonine protein kinase
LVTKTNRFLFSFCSEPGQFLEGEKLLL